MKTAIQTHKPSIQWTKNLDLFHPNPDQRKYHPAHAEDLARRIKEHGFPASLAISVYRDKDKKLVINTGHHRLSACKIAEAPIAYIVEEKWSARMLADEGTSSKNWSTRAVAEHYASKGLEDYLILLEYAAKGIPLNYAASMLRGEHAGSGNCGLFVRRGTFKVKTREEIDSLVSILAELRDVSEEIMSQSFILALSALLLIPEFDRDVFIKKALSFPAEIEKRSTRDQMLDQIEEIYNFRSRAQVNLSFLAKNNLRNRKKTFGR